MDPLLLAILVVITLTVTTLVFLLLGDGRAPIPPSERHDDGAGAPPVVAGDERDRARARSGRRDGRRQP